jgi:hypothetical protein
MLDGGGDNAVGSERYARRHDGDREREVILDGISTLAKACAAAHYWTQALMLASGCIPDQARI